VSIDDDYEALIQKKVITNSAKKASMISEDEEPKITVAVN
jgi:hypothetical protein